FPYTTLFRSCITFPIQSGSKIWGDGLIKMLSYGLIASLERLYLPLEILCKIGYLSTNRTFISRELIVQVTFLQINRTFLIFLKLLNIWSERISAPTNQFMK